jgi:lipopolysaccharide/colanic/teichoic acid biosynthesis glycosyltransferase
MVRPSYIVGKRIFDATAAMSLVLLLAPLVAIVACAVKLCFGTPVLLQQKRPGFGSKPFWILKFRTMTDAKDAKGNLLPDDLRLTTVGRFLRSTSLDELPELLNVVRGDMSLVGPRPLLMQYLDRYSPEQARRHEVKPGITGWSQVNGRNALSWEEKFALDVWYVDHCSFMLDMKILALTVLRVLQRDGIAQPGRATADEFMGSAR